MQYRYKYRVKISDLWQASMYYAYSSYMGVVNTGGLRYIDNKQMEGCFRHLQNGNDTFPVTFYGDPALPDLLRAHSSLRNGCPEIDNKKNNL